jgi:hypothetical protein
VKEGEKPVKTSKRPQERRWATPLALGLALFTTVCITRAQSPYLTNLDSAFAAAKENKRTVILHTGRVIYCGTNDPRSFYFGTILKQHPQLAERSKNYVVCEKFIFATNGPSGPTRLFDFSKLPGAYFAAERQGAPRKLLYCSTCACFGESFAQYTSDGSPQWHPSNKRAEAEPFEPPVPCQCQLDPAPIPPFATNPFRLKDASTLGGAPTWIQDSEYPTCPDCAKTMRFLAQFDNLPMQPP